jgi:hypothetical protein
MAIAGTALKGTEQIVGEIMDIFLLSMGLAVAFAVIPNVSSLTQSGIATIRSV